VLAAAGFPLPVELQVTAAEDLADVCLQVGFPLAMKVVGPLHKTDVGGVRLGIDGLAEARAAHGVLMAIPGACGVLLQPMIAGLEVILGASREDRYGHLVMFGLGGIHAEMLKDVRFSLAPLAAAEARGLIDGIRGRALLDGARGAPGLDTAVLAGLLVRLGRLVTDFPEIDEIDLNPVKGEGSRLLVVDARIIMAGTACGR
jgi:acetyltransferase